MTVRVGNPITLYGDRQFWPLSPDPAHVVLDDIASALSRICRFGGHCDRFYSVAQHSVFVSQIAAEVSPAAALPALLHDAAEVYLGDIVRPLKEMLWVSDPQIRPVAPMSHLADVEQRVHDAVLRGLGVPKPTSQDLSVIAHADEIALHTEADEMLGSPAWVDSKMVRGGPLVALDPLAARSEFLGAFYRYGGTTR